MSTKKKENKKKIAANKEWQKPTFITLGKNELAKHILAAARSGGLCLGGNSR